MAMFGLLIFSAFIPAIAAQAQNAEIENVDLLLNYYRNPQFEKVPAVLERFVVSDFLQKQSAEVCAMYAYLFGRIAVREPALIPAYMSVFEKMPPVHEGRIFILMIFRICGNEDVVRLLETKLDNPDYAGERQDIQNVLKGGLPVKFDPLTAEVKEAVDLDFLWADFFVTGDKKPVVKIIDVLTWPDRFMMRFREWAGKMHSKEEEERLERLLNRDMKMKIDFKRPFDEGAVDLDNFFAAKIVGATEADQSRSVGEINQILNITNDDIKYLSLKGAAAWSLRLNAAQHPAVLGYCKEEFERRKDKSKFELAAILENTPAEK